MSESDMFSAFAVCRVCGATVTDTAQHQRFHEGIEKAFTQVAKAFESRDKSIRRVFAKGGLVKRHPRPQSDVRGGRCKKCNGLLVGAQDVQYKGELRRSDSTIPYLVCLECGREIRRG